MSTYNIQHVVHKGENTGRRVVVLVGQEFQQIGGYLLNHAPSSLLSFVG